MWPQVARTLNNLGALYVDMGDREQALEHYQRSLLIKEVPTSLSRLMPTRPLSPNRVAFFLQQKLGADHPEVANTLHNMAAVYEDRHEYVDALELYQRALKIREVP